MLLVICEQMFNKELTHGLHFSSNAILKMSMN